MSIISPVAHRTAMNEYMILVGETEQSSLEQQRQLIEAREQFTQKLRGSGALLDAERLRPSSEGRRVKAIDGEPKVERGPFAGTAGAYWSVKANGLEAALALSKDLPLAEGESAEVRPIMKGEYDPKKTDKTGKVFAFAVLGNAPNEDAWIRLMDKIDHDTADHFGDGFLAGVRLEAPRTGRRLVNQHGKAVTLDGPFLESKEVIGGLFFMRLASLEDAVEWAKGTAFVRIGGAEIREVWRS
jgi:hypothetical protein